MTRSYDQYCPVAHALDLVGERWSLLVVRELQHGPARYSDLLEALPGCGTNILAARLKRLEQAGVLTRRRLPPPAGATVYELTEHGRSLRSVLRELAFWGARSLGPPAPGDLAYPGWLRRVLETAVTPDAFPATIEFRIGDEVASLVGGAVHEGPAPDPDAVVSAPPQGFFHLLLDRAAGEDVVITGDAAVLERLLASLPAPAPVPAPAPA